MSYEWVGLIRLWVDPYFFTCNFYNNKKKIVLSFFFFVTTNKRINKKILKI